MRRTTGGPPRSGRGVETDAGGASKISVLVVDDHEVVRQGLKALLSREPDIAIVGEARDGREAVESAERLRPDVVVSDVAMPRLNGIEAARQILDVVPDARVLLLSAHDDDEYVARAMRVGATGYVLKHASLMELADAIRAVRAGKTFVSASMPWHEHTRVHWTGDAEDPRPTPSPTELTSREVEVLQLIAESAGNKQIARDLGISVKTVEKHRQGLMAKLRIHDVAGLTRYAVSFGVVELGGAK